MKKTLFIIGIVMSLFATNTFAQEVRGIETRLATYEDKEYSLGYSYDYDYYEFGKSSDYLGFEFTNLNSIPVSVSVEIYQKGGELIDTKEIVLKSKESYICKYPTIQKYYCVYYGSNRVYCTSREYGTSKNWEKCAEEAKKVANMYYVKYKAFKLL